MFKRIKQNGWQRLAHFEVEHKCIIRNNSLVLIRGNKTRRKPWLLPEKYEETQTYVGQQKDCSPTAPGGYMKRHVHSQKAATECHRITRETHGNMLDNTTMKQPNDAHESIPKWHTKWHIGGRSAEWDKGSLGCEEPMMIPCFLMSPETYGFRWGWEHHCQTSEWNLNYQLLFVFCREWWNLMNIRGKWTQTRKVDQTLNIFAPRFEAGQSPKAGYFAQMPLAFFSLGIFWIFVVGNVQSRTETPQTPWFTLR